MADTVSLSPLLFLSSFQTSKECAAVDDRCQRKALTCATFSQASRMFPQVVIANDERLLSVGSIVSLLPSDLLNQIQLEMWLMDLEQAMI